MVAQLLLFYVIIFVASLVTDQRICKFLSMTKLEALPKGFRFRPTDEELVSHYLRLKINGHHSHVKVIPEVDICKWEPWDLPALSVIKSDDPEWFFFCPRDRKYPNGHRSNRATEAGYWKATGKDRTIKSRNSTTSNRVNAKIIGTKKTLVFYRGRAPKGERMNWIMHEYRATEPDLDGTSPGQEDYVLYRLFDKANEKLNDLKCDDLELARSSPSIYRSSPDDASSDLLLDHAAQSMHIINEVDDVKKWRDEDHLDYMSMPTESSTSNKAAIEGLVLSQEDLISGESECKQFNNKDLDPLPSHIYNDPGAFIGSPYADDFGNYCSGELFQDGASEQDVSLSELLHVFQSNDYIKEESNSCENFAAREFSIPDHADGLNIKYSASCEMTKGKIDGERAALMDQEQGPSTDGFLTHYADGEYDVSANKVNNSRYQSDDSFYYPNPATASSSTLRENGINIRPRLPRNQPNLKNSDVQGIASRRIRLLMEQEPKSVGDEKFKDAQSCVEESQPLVMPVSQDNDVTSKHQEPAGRLLHETIQTAPSYPIPSSGLQVTRDRKNGASVMHSKPISTIRRACYLNVYAIPIYLVIILSVVLLGVLRFPSWHAVHG